MDLEAVMNAPEPQLTALEEASPVTEEIQEDNSREEFLAGQIKGLLASRRENKWELGKYLREMKAELARKGRSGKWAAFLREVRLPRTSADRWIEEFEKAPNGAISPETQDEPKPFATGEAQADPQDEELKQLEAEEQKKADDARKRSNEGNHSTLTLHVHNLSPQERESFKKWQLKNVKTCQSLFHEVVMCVLEGVSAEQALISLVDLRPTAAPVPAVQEMEVPLVQ